MFDYFKNRVLKNGNYLKQTLVLSFIFVFSPVLSFCVNNNSVSAYSASISNSGPISTSVTPKNGGTGTSISTDEVNVTTNCRAGYNLTIAGPNDRNLYKDGNSANNTSGQYFTPVDGTSQLKNTTNAWGYSLTANTDTGIFTPLPNTPTPIRTPSQTASETDIDDDINIYYGVSVTNTLNPGSYTMSNNDTIVYQLTMDMSCNAFTVSYNANGGTGTMEGQDIVIGQSTKLTNNAFTAPAKGQSYQDADGTTIPADPDKLWVFWGWNTEVDGTGDWYKNKEEVLDLASSGDTITLYAQWKQATLADIDLNQYDIPILPDECMAVKPGDSLPEGCKLIDHNTMQDMSAEICYNSPITTANDVVGATLTDNRDGTIRSYDVSKLADGVCWMTTNLALGSATDDITLTSDNTDLADNTSFTLPAADTTSYTATTNLPKVRLTNNSGTTDNGAYYTWNAAVANTTSTSSSPTTSICPKNWDLPTNTQYTNLSSKSSYSSSNPTTAAPSSFLTNGGFTNGASFYQTGYSHFWTSTSYSTTAAYGARVNSTTMNTYSSTGSTYGGNKYYRKNIRCVASAGNANITYHSNNTAGATSTQSTDIGTGKLASSNLFTPEPNRQFKEWNTRPDGTGTSYAANASASSTGLYPDQSLDLYAIWNEVYYIAFDANEASVGGTPGSATGTMTNQTVPRNIATAIKTNTFALTGYIFRGWNTAADGTGTFYGDGQKVTNLTSTGNTITLYADWVNGALLDTGRTVNQKLKRLAGNSSASYSTQDNTITAIARSNALPNGFTPATENTISASSSPIPIYAWYDSTNTTIYYYSDATTIMMNQSSDYFFYQMRALSDLSTISTWDTAKVKYMSYMFYSTGYNVSSFTLNLSSWNTASVTNMSGMFSSAGYSATNWSIGDLSSWNTASVTNMDSMFASAGRNATTWSIGDLSLWNTASVTDMYQMFSSAGYSATTWSIGDLSSWNTASVTNMANMFSDAGRSATTWSIGDLSSWNTASVTTMSSMFSYAGYNATTWSIGDISSWNTASVTSMDSIFSSAGRNATTWSIGDLSEWNTASVTNMQSMFSFAGYNATTWSIGDISSWNTASVTNMSGMFNNAGRSATTWSIGDISSWNTASVNYMSNMFSNTGYNATSFTLDLSSWNTSSVKDMSGMFSHAGYNATTWSISGLSSWNTASVTNMSYMFSYAGYNATTFTLNLSLWNTASVTRMDNMFSYAGYSATTWSIGDLSLWNTASVTTMESMFSDAGYSATSWSIGDLSLWNTASVTNMSSMFSYAGYNATSFTLDLSSWNTASVTNMNSMFRSSGQNSSIWSVGNLSSWNTSNVTNMQFMFFFAGDDASTFILDLSSWNTTSVTNMSNMISSNRPKATTWSVTIPKTNDGTATGPIANTTSNLYGKTTSVTLAAPLGKSFTLAN